MINLLLSMLPSNLQKPGSIFRIGRNQIVIKSGNEYMLMPTECNKKSYYFVDHFS